MPSNIMLRKVFVLGRSAVPVRSACAVMAVLLLGVAGDSVAGQGLTARVAPEFSSIGFDPSVGLDDAGFFGAAGALGFGRFVVLRASYKSASTQTALVGSGYGTAAEENSVDASLLSTSVQLRLGSGRFAPVLLGGGGIMTFSPVGRSDVKQIAATYGGGVDARLLPWLDGQLLVHPVRFRFDRAAVADDSGGPPPVDPNASDLRNSLALSASLGARLGGARSSSRADALDSDVSRALQGGEGLMIPVAVMAGVMRFSEGLGIDDQSTAGIRAGLDFGPYFGVRGSYARGFSNTSFVGMSSWSGEAQFNVGKVTGFSPHVLLGYGGISFWGDYVGQNGFLPDDENALIVGAGFGLPVSERARLIVQLRDHLTTTGEVAGVSTPSDVRHNFGLSAGLSFNLRGGRQTLGQPVGGARPVLDQVATPSTGEGAPSAGAGSAPPTATTNPGDPVTPTSTTDTAMPMSSVADTVRVVTPSTFQSDRVVSIPIPTEGELYIRYGPPAQRDAVVAAPQPSPSLPLIQSAAATGDSAATTGAVTRNDLAALETTIAAMVRTEMARRDSLNAERLTREDLASIETRLAQQLAAAVAERTERPVAEPARSPELAALSAQVTELAALVRQRSEVQTPQPMMVTLSPTGEVIEVPGGSGAPFFRGADFLMGTSSVRNGNVGFGVRADVMVSEMLSGRLRPYVGAQLAQTGVDGTLGGTPYGGSVLSVGGGLGVATSLPSFRSIAPELSVGVVGVTGGVSGDSQPEADIMETIYGGFVMGPRVAIDAVWRGADRGPFAIAGGIARTWAGARGGWSIQMGIRWQRPFTRRQQLFVPASGGQTTRPAAQPVADTTPPPVQRDTAQAVTRTEPAAPAVDSLTMTRIADLERALEEERAARQAMLAATDSAAQAAEAARARADSVSRATAAANSERAATESAAARRAAIRTELESLLGVVEDVQSVRETSRGLEVTIGGGVFPTSSVSLEGSARARVMRVASILARTEGYAFLVDGHTDSTGSDETNRAVSEARAEAVRSVLISAGIRPQQISVLASGEDRPIAGNDTRDGRAQNRRVEIVILDY